MVVTYVASHIKVDYLCVDRSFSSISGVAEFGMHKVAKVLFRLLTSLDFDSSKNYYLSNAYKIITFDPNDKVIPCLGSMAYGAYLEYLSDQNLGEKSKN